MAKGIMYIDGQRVPFDGEKKRPGCDPEGRHRYAHLLLLFGTVCLRRLPDVRGGGRAGQDRRSCSMEPRDGMVIRTNTARLLKHRRMILELMLSSHCRDCTTCEKSGHCRLQELAQQFGVRRIRFPDTREHYEIDSSSPAVLRDPNKCILCGDCVRMCDNVQSVNAIDFAYRGTSTLVTPAFNKTIAQTNCVNCGQCRVFCPTGAISIKTHMEQVWDA